MPTILKATELTKRYGNVVALDHLDLEVSAGETVCLLGANGAGKSTTISLFLGFLKPSDGRAEVMGVDAADRSRGVRQHLGYIPENVALYDALSGAENLEVFERLGGGHASRAALEGLLLEAGLPEDAIHRRAATYSKGMRQKVGIAIAMAKKARALLLDEPLSGLDPSAANDFCALIRRFRDGGGAILMATHDIFRAKDVGTRIGIMRQGRLVEMLDPSTLGAQEIEAIYLSHMQAGAA